MSEKNFDREKLKKAIRKAAATMEKAVDSCADGIQTAKEKIAEEKDKYRVSFPCKPGTTFVHKLSNDEVVLDKYVVDSNGAIGVIARFGIMCASEPIALEHFLEEYEKKVEEETEKTEEAESEESEE